MGDALSNLSGVSGVPMSGDNDQSDNTNYAKEYDQCRAEINKFDTVLVDLRKYGFTLLTGITTAGSFLGFSAPTRTIQFGVILVTMVLVMVLYWLDIYYQILIAGAVLRSSILEKFILNRKLSLTITKFYDEAAIGSILHFLYIGFLTGLLLLGLFVIGIDNVIQFIFYGVSMSNENMNTFAALFIGYGVTLYAIIIIYFRSDRAKKRLIGRFWQDANSTYTSLMEEKTTEKERQMKLEKYVKESDFPEKSQDHMKKKDHGKVN